MVIYSVSIATNAPAGNPFLALSLGWDPRAEHRKRGGRWNIQMCMIEETQYTLHFKEHRYGTSTIDRSFARETRAFHGCSIWHHIVSANIRHHILTMTMLGGPSLVHFDPHAFLDGVLRMTRQSVVAQNVLTHTHTPASSGVNPRVCFLSLIFPVSETVTKWGT